MKRRKSMNIRLFFKRILICFVSILLLLCITGCQNKGDDTKENIYKVNYDTTIYNYLSLSQTGNDYLIPKLSEKYWDEFGILDKECQVAKSKNREATFYIIRDIDINNDCEYIKQLDSDDLISIIHKIAKSYLGDIRINKKSVNHLNDIKYTDIKGKVGNMNCYMSCFQSYCEIPSVNIRYIPTAYIIVYNDEKNEKNVMGMIKTIKEWTIRAD